MINCLKQTRLIIFNASKLFNKNIAHAKNSFPHLHLVKTLSSVKMPRYEYPTVRRDMSVKENFHGTAVLFHSFVLFYLNIPIVFSIFFKIADPYRWLEDPDSEETQKFVEDQNKLTQSFLELCKYRSKIRER